MFIQAFTKLCRYSVFISLRTKNGERVKKKGCDHISIRRNGERVLHVFIANFRWRLTHKITPPNEAKKKGTHISHWSQEWKEKRPVSYGKLSKNENHAKNKRTSCQQDIPFMVDSVSSIYIFNFYEHCDVRLVRARALSHIAYSA